MDVGVWLRSLGLGRYEVAFRENSVDADVLADLTESDLEKLGVTLGDRKRLLRAIAKLGVAEPTAKPTSLVSTSSSATAAERRPIAVMFCDLVGSTSIAANLDAEDSRNLVNEYLDKTSAAVTNFGGHVLKKLGDGLMALFGYPHAQENDAERRCAPHSLSSARSPNSTRRTPRPGRWSSLPASASKAAQLSSTRAEKCLAKRPISLRASRRQPSPGPFSLHQTCNDTSPASSSSKTKARMS